MTRLKLLQIIVLLSTKSSVYNFAKITRLLHNYSEIAFTNPALFFGLTGANLLGKMISLFGEDRLLFPSFLSLLIIFSRKAWINVYLVMLFPTINVYRLPITPYPCLRVAIFPYFKRLIRKWPLAT